MDPQNPQDASNQTPPAQPVASPEPAAQPVAPSPDAANMNVLPAEPVENAVPTSAAEPAAVAQEVASPAVQPAVAPEQGAAPSPDAPVGSVPVAPPPASPVDPTAAPTNVMSGGMPPAAGSPLPSAKKGLPKWLLPVVIAVVVVALAATAYFVFFANKLSLTKYSGDSYSLLVPTDYEKDTSDPDAVTFTEKTGDEKTQSMVGVSYQSYGQTVSDDDLDKAYSELSGSIDQLVSGQLSGSNKLVSKETSTNDYQGHKALTFTAELADEDNVTVGHVHARMVLDNDGLYVVIVAAHSGDKNLEKSANKILDSLDIKS